MIPEYVYDFGGGYCENCSSLVYGFPETTKKKECVICTEESKLIVLPCKHELCRLCWGKISYPADDVDIILAFLNDESEPINDKCPICRKVIFDT